MLGVRRFVFPLMLKSPQPWSSARMMTTLGFADFSAAEDSEIKITIKSKIMKASGLLLLIFILILLCQITVVATKHQVVSPVVLLGQLRQRPDHSFPRGHHAD